MDNMQDTVRDTIDETIEESTEMDIKEAEEAVYEELKPRYISNVSDNWQSSALKKDSMHLKNTNIAKEVFDDDESMKYAVKKHKFLFEKD